MRIERISQLQFALIVYITTVSTAILLGPSVISEYAGNDLWLSPVWGGLIGFLTLYVALSLGRYYPRETFIQYSQHIIGRIPGKVLGMIYLLLQLELSGWVVRDYTGFVSIFLTQTPPVVISSTLIFVCAMAVYAGIETLGRAAQLFFFVCTIPLVLTILLVLKDLKPDNFFPVLASGVFPSINGALYPATWLSEIFLLFFFFPSLKDKARTGNVVMKTIIGSTVTMIVVNTVTLMLLGNNITNSQYPIIDTANYISIGDFLENLESAIMAIWVMAVFVKLSVFYYIVSLSTVDLFGLKSIRTVAAPIGLLILVFSLWGLPSFAAVSEMRPVIYVVWLMFFVLIPSCLLLIVRFLKPKGRKEGNAP